MLYWNTTCWMYKATAYYRYKTKVIFANDCIRFRFVIMVNIINQGRAKLSHHCVYFSERLFEKF